MSVIRKLWSAMKRQGGLILPKRRVESWPDNVPDDEVVLQLLSMPPHYIATIVKIVRTFNDGSGQDETGTENITVGKVEKVSQAIIANQTNKAIALEFTNSKLKVFAAISDVAMTVKTNDGSSPQETLTLVANQPFCWTLTGSRIGSAASPFGGNVTGLFVTNTTAGTLKIIAGVDPT